VAFETPFYVENSPQAIIDFSFFKVQRQAKSVIVNMIRNFFNSYNQEYKLQIPEVADVQSIGGNEKIFIERDFPYGERKIPCIIVSIESAKEKKMYMGVDNLIGYKRMGTSTGVFPVFGGASVLSLKLVVVAESSEMRMKLAELLNMCFTHYYRWQYFYTLEDGNTFSIVPNTGLLDFGAESELKDLSKDTYIYMTTVSMEAFVEYTFSRTKSDINTLENIDITGFEVLAPDLTT